MQAVDLVVVVAVGDVVEERAVVVGEGIVVAAVVGFDRFEDQERHMRRIVVAVPGLKSKDSE